VTPPVVLTIGGTDPSAGTGILADLKTFAAHRVYGVSVVTAVTAPRDNGLDDVFPVPATLVGTQLSSILADFRVAAVKVGMLATGEIASVVAAKARAGALPNLVVEPNLLSGKGSRMGVTASVRRLMPYAAVLTPDVDEASALVGWPVATTADMAGAAGQLCADGAKCVVVTGGDLTGDEAVDATWTSGGARFLRAPRVRTANTRGTGAAFAAAITARLALGEEVSEAVMNAKEYVGKALQAAVEWKVTSGAGPLNHFGF
jgi:hydroxymethylpyrimidine/phosphomethylpyrimidine kinase